jgi:hypothetical protein
MAGFKEDFTAGLKGRIGKLVVYQFLGKTVVRSMPAKKRAPAQGAQKKTQNEFALVMKIMQSMTAFVRVGFHDAAQGRTAFQSALSVNLRRRRESEHPENLHWVLASMGERAAATGLNIERAENRVKVTWDVVAPGKPASGDDRVMLLALNTTSLAATHDLDTTSRMNGEATLALPPTLPGERILIFITFHNPLRSEKKSLKNISESIFRELIVE